MATNAKTKIVVGLGLLDITRQIVTAWSAKRQAERDRIGFGAGLRHDFAALARDTRERAQDRLPHHFEWGLPPWRREPTFADRARAWGPVAVIIVLATAAIALAAHWIVEHEPEVEPDEVATTPKVVGAIRAGSEAIDAGVQTVVHGGSAAAVGTASAVAAGSSAVKAAVIDRSKEELDARVIAPAKQKAVKIGVVAALGLTAYVVVIAALVQVVVAALT